MIWRNIWWIIYPQLFFWISISDKSCYRKDRRHQNPFKKLTITEPKDTNGKVFKCQEQHCQTNKRCFYFSFNTKTNECLLHEDGNFEEMEGYYGAPKYCGKFMDFLSSPWQSNSNYLIRNWLYLIYFLPFYLRCFSTKQLEKSSSWRHG